MTDLISRNRLMFFSALLLSAFGYEFVYFIMTVHIYDLGKSALNVGIFTTLAFVPKLFSSLLGGISDRLGKEKSLAFASCAAGILMLIMSFAKDMAVLYIIWFFASVFFSVIINARSALMADVIAGEHYSAGNALALSLLNCAKLLGPLLGGLIVMSLSIRVLLYFTCAVYFAVALSSCRIKTTLPAKQVKLNSFANMKKGFAFMLENNTFGYLTLISFFWRLFLGMQLSLFIIYVETYLHCTSRQYGLFMTVMGLGSIAGSILGPLMEKKGKPICMITAGLGLHYASFVFLGLCPDYYLSLLIVFAGFAALYMTLVRLHSLRDRITPFDIRGSAYGTVTSVLTPAAILSMLAGSYFAERFSVSSVLLFAGIAALMSLLIINAVNHRIEVLMQQAQGKPEIGL